MGLLEDITQAVARMEDDDSMRGGRAVRKSASKSKSKSKSKKHQKRHAVKKASPKKVKKASPKKSGSKRHAGVVKKSKSKSASKRGLSGYHAFMKKEMASIRAKSPNAKQSEVLSAAAHKWSSKKK